MNAITNRNDDTAMIRLAVKNLGPIGEANVDLRPLTVFVGPSNTGKSYLAVLIYALHRFFSSPAIYNEHRRFLGWPYFEGHRMVIPAARFTPSEEQVNRVLEWSKAVLEYPAPEGSAGPDVHVLPQSVAELVRPVLEATPELGSVLDQEIARCFGTGVTSALSRDQSYGGVSFFLGDTVGGADGERLGYGVAFDPSGLNLRATLPPNLPLKINGYSDIALKFPPHLSDERFWESDSQNDVVADDLLRLICQEAVSYILGPLGSAAYYLPTGRAGIMHAQREVMRGLIASASQPGLNRSAIAPSFSGVRGDLFAQLLDVNAETDGTDDLRTAPMACASNFEDAMLDGSIVVLREEGGFPVFAYRPTGWSRNLPLTYASAMVTDLAPVMLYLRHVVRLGDTLIVEEPESSIHPVKQVELTRQLAAVVKSGVRVIVTTHSEWILEELANLVRMSELPEERRLDLEGADVALTKDQVGAWHFDPGDWETGTMVREIGLDVDSGTFPAGYGLVTEDLYNRWAMISDRIEEG